MMTKYKRRDVISVAIPYTDDPDESKKRPAMIISPDVYNQSSGYVIVLPITSNLGAKQPGDVSIVGQHIEASALKHPSIIKVGYPTTVDVSKINRVMGTMR